MAETLREFTCTNVIVPSIVTFPWEKDLVSQNKSTNVFRTIALQSLIENPLVHEYLLEVDFNKRLALSLGSKSLINDVPVSEDEISFPSASVYYMQSQKKKRRRLTEIGFPRTRSIEFAKDSANAEQREKSVYISLFSDYYVVLTNNNDKSLHKLSLTSCSGFVTLSPGTAKKLIDEARAPECGVLVSTHPLRRKYGDFIAKPFNSICMVKKKKRKVTSSQQTDKTVQFVLEEFLMNPLIECSLQSILPTSLKPLSTQTGSYSPVSPIYDEQNLSLNKAASAVDINDVVVDSQSNFNPNRNKRLLCPIPHLPVDFSFQKKKQSKLEQVWSWDKTGPLSVPSLCSCVNESLYEKVWKPILFQEHQLCSSSIRNRAEDNNYSWINDIDWKSVSTRSDFSSFFSCLTKSIQNSHFCLTCGGLVYIPYSVIEICLNRFVPTLNELVETTPLPVPTEIFCNGLKITACFVAKCPAHEWLIVYALRLVELTKTLRIYSVCSGPFLPFHYNADKSKLGQVWSSLLISPEVLPTSPTTSPALQEFTKTLPISRTISVTVSPPECQDGSQLTTSFSVSSISGSPQIHTTTQFSEEQTPPSFNRKLFGETNKEAGTNSKEEVNPLSVAQENETIFSNMCNRHNLVTRSLKDVSAHRWKLLQPLRFTHPSNRRPLCFTPKKYMVDTIKFFPEDAKNIIVDTLSTVCWKWLNDQKMPVDDSVV